MLSTLELSPQSLDAEAPVFQDGVEQMTLDGKDWSGTFWLQDLWRKSSMTRRWSLVERSLSRTDDDDRVAIAIRSLQLWR